ncbi:putative resolvase [Clostridium sartagoforme AAU1]|uniref:Putative resolvase n=1 Tax=Clostridium sartagoforme AAU1 TaxID=1202534 RepID=R9C022_9CLOT|nr:recombinase family protein [Clostridium sartagoforme]EOR20561.1 putative resolvase [Clostridium sartagoforme AAU1]
MKKVAIYVRVSTTYQADKDSLPLQKSDLINYSKFVLGIDDYEIFEDAGYSGKNTSRPDYQQMINRIKTGEFSHLLVWKIDRISRNLIDFCDMYEELKKYNCTFVSKNEQFDTSSAMGEAMLKIILVFAELERKLTGERVTAVMIDRATKGLWNGAPLPLGYAWDKVSKFPVIDEMEKKTVELIFSMYKQSESTSVVRNMLNENKLKTKRDGSWTTKTVSDIIRNPFYKGTYRYNYRESARGKKKKENEWIIVEDNHPAIITKDLWQECNAIMDLNAERNNAKFRSNVKTHIFSSLIQCGECGNNMYAKQDKPHLDGYTPSLYACKGRYNKLGCSQKTVSDTIVAEFILNFISNMMKISKIRKTLSVNELEENLLLGNTFKNIIGIKEIDHVFNSIYFSNKSTFKLQKDKENKVIDFNIEQLQSQLKKYQKALSKLEDLYLFDEAEMSTKDYIIKKNTINDKIKEINKKLDNSITKESSSYNINFILNVTTLELSKQLMKGNIKIKSLINNTGRDIIKDFINTLINKIIVKDKQVKSVEFKNGLIVTFLYNS